MALQYAFSTVACPDWTLDKVAEQAKALGYDSVELRTLGAGSAKLACDPALSTPDKVRSIFEKAGVKIACLSTSSTLHQKTAGEGQRAYFEIVNHLETAAAIGAPFVRIFGLKIMPNENRQSVIQRIAQRVPALAEKAGELGVELLFENAGSFSAAKEWWWLLNLVNHPMAGLLWNVANAASVDPHERGGGMAVTMLNSRIRMAKVKDTQLGKGVGFVQLGDGDVNIEQFLKKLRGIGFDGTVTVEWDRAWLPSLAPAEEALPEALKRLKAWNKSIDDLMAEGRSEAEKSATKRMPKSRKELLAAPVKA